MTIDYQEKIPNNVDLNEDRRLQRALERWLPGYQQWWHELGPAESESMDVYLRTAISVESGGWANYGHVRMPDYRWGIFLAHPEADRRVNFGMHKPGRAAPPDRHPGRHRAGIGRAAASTGQDLPVALRPAQPVPSQRRGGPAPLGHGLPAARLLRS
jgi:benzoyl-CoA 2,3-dioxygenase component B